MTPDKPQFPIGTQVLVACHHWTGPLDHHTSSLPPVPGEVVHISNGYGPSAVQYVVKLLADAGFGWYKGDTYRARHFQLQRSGPL